MADMINIYLYGKKYEVPSNLTIMTRESIIADIYSPSIPAASAEAYLNVSDLCAAWTLPRQADKSKAVTTVYRIFI